MDTWVDPDSIVALVPSLASEEQCLILLRSGQELRVDLTVEAVLGALDAFEQGYAASRGDTTSKGSRVLRVPEGR